MQPYYSKVLILALLPVLIIIVSVVFWASAALIKRRKEYMNVQLVSTIIIVLLLIHPNVIKTMTALFSCTEIDNDEWWLTDELDIRCWDNEHIWYVTRVSVPALLLWGVGIPCV